MTSSSPIIIENASQAHCQALDQQFWEDSCQLPIARQYTTLWIADGEITSCPQGSSKKTLRKKCSVVMLSRSRTSDEPASETPRRPLRVKFCKDDPMSIAQRLESDHGAAALMDESFATSASSEQPFPSTASIFHLAADDRSFNDSGVDFPLPNLPDLSEGSRSRQLQVRGKPSIVRLRSATPIAEPSGITYRKHSLFHENLHLEEQPLEVQDINPWTFEEHLVISLLIASDDTPPKGTAGPKRFSILSRNRLFARTSEKIAKLGRRLKSMLFAV